MKKELDDIDFDILKNAVRLSPAACNKGARMREVYRPFLDKHCDSFLWQRIIVLADESYLNLERLPGRHVIVRPTKKTYKLMEHNGPKEGGA